MSKLIKVDWHTIIRGNKNVVHTELFQIFPNKLNDWPESMNIFLAIPLFLSDLPHRYVVIQVSSSVQFPADSINDSVKEKIIIN